MKGKQRQKVMDKIRFVRMTFAAWAFYRAIRACKIKANIGYGKDPLRIVAIAMTEIGRLYQWLHLRERCYFVTVAVTTDGKRWCPGGPTGDDWWYYRFFMKCAGELWGRHPEWMDRVPSA